MKELTKNEMCRLMYAINVEGIDNTSWLIESLYEKTNAQDVFGTDDNTVVLEPAKYLAVWCDTIDGQSMFFRLTADIVGDGERCVWLDTEVLLFRIDDCTSKITIR